MFDTDLLIVFVLMGLIFVRQMVIIKEPYKINYAPFLLGVGAIGSLTHLLLHPETEDFVLLFREALLPFFVSIALFLVLYVMHQAQSRSQNVVENSQILELLNQMRGMQKSIKVLEENVNYLNISERDVHEKVRHFNEDETESFEKIQANQKAFMSQFVGVHKRQEEMLEKIASFTEEKLPDLDNVVHRHIDMLRIAEQDHFNQLKSAINVLNKSSEDNGLESVKSMLHEYHTKQQTTLNTLVDYSKEGISDALKDFTSKLQGLRSQSEGLGTALREDEEILRSIRSQSELIMKQMLLSSTQMEKLEDKGKEIASIFIPVSELTGRLIAIKDDYIRSKLELNMLAESLQSIEEFQFEKMREHIEAMTQEINERLEGSLAQLHEHYHIAQKDISNTVQELSSKAQIVKSYGDE